MIQKFKKKTTLILTLIFWIILIGILLTVNISNYQSNLLETKKLLQNQNSIVPLDVVKNAVAPTSSDRKISKISSVRVDTNGNYTVAFKTEGSGYTDEEMIQIAKDIDARNQSEGVLKHFRYKVTDSDSGRIISFIDYGIWEGQQYRMLLYSLLICVGGMIILFFVAFFLTRWLVKPVIEAFDKQKQFISDAGHELKTPLTIMKSGLDMLESDYGKDKNFGYLKEENNRMTDLVYELLSLSRLENTEEKIRFEKIDLSRIVEGTCLPFECLAYENGCKLELEIQEGITIAGSEKQIQQLVDVLVDNAIKHTDRNGSVVIQLKKDKGKAVLQVKNEGDPIPEDERSKIFDRFYRVDKARSRKEGRFGLGLAIASTIAEAHKSRILIDCKENWTIFYVKFNL